jgi:signal peptidase I
LLISVCLASLAGLTAVKLQHIKFFEVQSGSMAPVIVKGDLVIDIPASPAAIRVGDLITYKNPANTELVTHRVLSVNTANGYIITKGDNLTQADPPVALQDIKGKTIKAMPKLGYALDALHKPLGLVLIVYTPGMLIVFAELWRLAGYYRQKEYQLT